MEFTTLIALAAIAFISTNIDGMFVTIGFFVDDEYSSRNVLFGQILGIWVITFVSLALAQTLYVIPKGYTGWLGIVPIAFGVIKILRIYDIDCFRLLSTRPTVPKTYTSQVQEVSLLIIATGGDNIATYVPIFAAMKYHEVAALLVMFALMTGCWWMTAQWLAEHELIRKHVANSGHYILPLIMIAIGVIIITTST